MPQTAMIAMAATQVVGAVKGYQAGKAGAKEARQAGEAEYQNSLFQEGQARTEADYRQGAENASVGASGLTTAGSPLQVMAARARQQELEALTIRYGGESARRAYQSKANIADSDATGALISGIGRAGQTFASSGGSSSGPTNFLQRSTSSWNVPDGETVYRKGSR